MTSQPDLLSRGNKRPKEDDEASTSLKEVKRRRSPPLETQKHSSHDFNDAKSIPSTPPPEPLPPNDTGSDTAPDSAYSLVEYAQEENTGHPPPRLLRDLETRAITVPQLIQEVKGIYAGLGKYIMCRPSSNADTL